MTKPIDFEHMFHHYVAGRLREAGEIDEDAAEEMAEQLYEEWADTPNTALDGLSPRGWFARFTSPQELTELLIAYARADLDAPDLLLERFEDLGAACAQPLEALVGAAGENIQARAQALGLLPGIDEALAVRLAVETVLHAGESDPLNELAGELLQERSGAEIRDALLAGYAQAPEFAKMLMLEILCNFPGDERIYTNMMDMLKNRPENRAFAAKLLGRYGDARAVEPLKAMLGQSDLTYFEYMEIRNAVEALGGEIETEREFYGDPDYEYLRNLE